MTTTPNGENGLRLSGTDDAGLLQGQQGLPAHPFGVYRPRACPCGESHLDRYLYWTHRIAAETASERSA